MADTAADVITQALLEHRGSAISMDAGTHLRPTRCTCGARDLAYGDRWEAHHADVAAAALTQADLLGPLGQAPIVTRTDVMPEARWRAAALEIVTAWTVPGRMPQMHAAAQEFVAHNWPTLAGAIDRLVRAKAELLREKP